MKVIHVLNTNKFSGAENVACVIISLLRKQGIDAYYCSPDGPIRQALEERNIPFLPIQALSHSEIIRIVKEQKPDVLHAHDMRASFVCAFARGKAKVISHIHNNAFDSRRLSMKSIAFLLAYPRIRHIFWVSESAKNGFFFRNFVKNKSSVLHNIIDVDAVRRKAASDPNEYHYDAVFVGRLEQEKDPERLLRVFHGVHQSIPEARFAIIGSGSMEESLKAQARALNIDTCVDFLGFQSNPLKMLQCSKVMVMTSRFEGLPMCALEAQALGVPIVSTPTDGLKEIIENGKNGWLSFDDCKLALYVIDIISNFNIQAEFARNSRNSSIKINDICSYLQTIQNCYDISI